MKVCSNRCEVIVNVSKGYVFCSMCQQRVLVIETAEFEEIRNEVEKYV